MRTLVGHTGEVYSLAVGRRDGNLYSGTGDCTIGIWRGDDGALLQTLEGHTNSVSALLVGLDGTLFSASDDRTLRVWRVDSGTRMLAHTVECASVVNTLAIGQSGTMCSGDDNGSVIIW